MNTNSFSGFCQRFGIDSPGAGESFSVIAWTSAFSVIRAEIMSVSLAHPHDAALQEACDALIKATTALSFDDPRLLAYHRRRARMNRTVPRPPAAPSPIEKKGDPIPTRFDGAEDKLIRKINAQTGLPMAEIIRRAVRFAGPKFDSGEINILDVIPETEEVPA